MSGHATAESLSLYLDAALPAAERQRVENHLHGCPDCRRRLDGLRRVGAGLGRLPAAAAPEDLAARVAREVNLRGRRGRWGRLLEDGLPAPFLASPPMHILALVLALGAIIYLFAHGLEMSRERPTRIVLPGPGSVIAEPGASGTPAAARVAGASLYLFGGRFERLDGVWIEEGLADAVPDAYVALNAEGAGAATVPEVAELAALGAPVRMRVGQLVVEIVLVSADSIGKAQLPDGAPSARVVRPPRARSPGGSG